MPNRDAVLAPRTVRSPTTGRLLDHPDTATDDPSAWVSAIAEGLTAAGFTARLDDPQAAQAVTVTVHQPGRREADIILDEDGYAELRWWPGPDTTPAEVTGLIARLLAVITIPPAGS